MLKIGVVGAGSYGTCLTKLFSDSGHDVALWCRSPELAATLRTTRENEAYLPGYKLAESVTISADLADVVADKQMVVGVTPSHALRDVMGRAAAHMSPDTIVVNTSKGLEEGSLDTIDQIYQESFSERMWQRAGYLSGPTFAKEIAAGLPAAIVLACRDDATAELVQTELSFERFRVYTSHDVTGVLIGGALKNIVAIAAGVSDGLGFGLNARAALITRGLAEIRRMGEALGADAMTFQGLSGLGDLVLTCSGDLSRNRRVGLALGKGKKIDAIIADMRMVAEGVKTTRVAKHLAAKLGVDAPITDFMYSVLYEDRAAVEAISALMTRSLKRENE